LTLFTVNPQWFFFGRPLRSWPNLESSPEEGQSKQKLRVQTC